MSILRETRALRREGRQVEAAERVLAALRRGVTPEVLAGAGRRLRQDRPHLDVSGPRVLLVGQFTTDWLKDMLLAVLWSRGLCATVDDHDYDQVVQALSTLQPNEADVVVLLPWHTRLLATGDVDTEVGFWQDAVARVRELGATPVLLTHDLPGPGPEGVLRSTRSGAIATVRRANASLRELTDHVVDLERVAGELGRRRFYDPRRWAWTKQPFSEEGAATLARHLGATLTTALLGRKKVLVLDCDHTLWGGVVGELGALGVDLGGTASGEAFVSFQQHCAALARAGVLLAVCTKNNPDDARGPFAEHPDSVLKLEDFSAFEAGWGRKSDAIRRIAEQLNLGLDSVVFFDDNPAEREEVRSALPTVTVVDVPTEPARYVAALEDGLWFEATEVTEEDRLRVAQYRAERVRTAERQRFDSPDAWLASMEMRGEVRPLVAEDMARAVQLIGKTNQFNLTTRRHPRSFLEGLADRPDALALSLRMRDRFGDHGLVGVVLAQPEGEALHLDTWLMSCRVMGRTAEQFLLGEITRRAAALGFTSLLGEMVPTAKNVPVQDLYPRLGFTPVRDRQGHWFRRDTTTELPTTWVLPCA